MTNGLEICPGVTALGTVVVRSRVAFGWFIHQFVHAFAEDLLCAKYCAGHCSYHEGKILSLFSRTSRLVKYSSVIHKTDS